MSFGRIFGCENGAADASNLHDGPLWSLSIDGSQGAPIRGIGMYHQRRSQHEVTFVFRHNEAPFWQEETKQCRGRHATNPQDCAAWRRLPEKSLRWIRQNVPAVVTMSQLYTRKMQQRAELALGEVNIGRVIDDTR